MVLATVLVFVINQRSFGWTMPLSPSWRTLLSAPVLGAAAGLVAGIYPAWRASRVVPAQALREE
jgi:putative ABC transport system permease protein